MLVVNSWKNIFIIKYMKNLKKDKEICSKCGKLSHVTDSGLVLCPHNYGILWEQIDGNPDIIRYPYTKPDIKILEKWEQ